MRTDAGGTINILIIFLLCPSEHKDNWMCRARGTHAGEKECMSDFGAKSRRKEPLET
jgi:hypothetical protein